MAEAPLQVTNAATCKAWLARLPLTKPAQCHALLAAQAAMLSAAPIAPAAKLEILEVMRGPVAEAQAEIVKGFRSKPIPLERAHQEAWEGAVDMWRSMAAAYDALIDAMAGGAADLAIHANLICQRALRYTALAMNEYCQSRHAVSGALWQQLHRLYVFSENAGIATTSVKDTVGRLGDSTSCAATYVHALLLHLAQPDALSAEQIDVVDRWLDRWESTVTLSADPLPQGPIPAVAVDLASQKGAGLAKQMPAAGVRHLNLDALSRTLRQTSAALKQQTPASLGLAGNLSREACERLLLQLHMQWCAAGTGRSEERTPASIKVMISPNLASMHFHLTGKAYRAPGGELTAAERQRLDMFGSVSAASEHALASQRSAALETWVIVNQSVSGFLGTAREKEVTNRISHHQLVALQPPAKKVMYLGIVQRLYVDEAGTIWIGLRIIMGAPQAVSARPAEAGAKYDRALLMPEDAARNIPASIVMMPGLFQANRVLQVHDGSERKIKLQALLDQGVNFERATYS